MKFEAWQLSCEPAGEVNALNIRPDHLFGRTGRLDAIQLPTATNSTRATYSSHLTQSAKQLAFLDADRRQHIVVNKVSNSPDRDRNPVRQ